MGTCGALGLCREEGISEGVGVFKEQQRSGAEGFRSSALFPTFPVVSRHGYIAKERLRPG